jgi:ankyrin repeat protein
MNPRASLLEWLDQIDELVPPGVQVMYSPLHWLAIHDDYRAIDFLLKSIKPRDTDQLMRLCSETYKGESPLDLAGQNGCIKAAMVLIRFFQKNFAGVEELFNGKK